MVSSTATSVERYLDSLPPDRRIALEKLRRFVRRNLERGFEEGMLNGMIGWYVPLSRHPDTYNGQPLCAVALASQKNYMSLYLMSVYGDRDLARWFEAEYAKSGKKLDMGKSCLRFGSVDALALDVLAKLLKQTTSERFIARYRASRGKTRDLRRKPKRRAPQKRGQ
jgi:hypothetical protein